jgi:formate hydrogenlyase subunit 4
MNIILIILQTVLFISLAPLLAGFIKAIKCKLQNRKGPPIYQPYRDLRKLFGKELLIPNTASWIFHVTPYLVLSIMVLAASITPFLFITPTNLAIADAIALIGIFALARFFLALAGMDIGTTFGGMGSSREMLIGAIAEPALLMAFFTLAMITSSTNFTVMIPNLLSQNLWITPSLIFSALGFALVAIAETGHIPIDNPETHLELTMIHEAMILEYSGYYLALIEWASQIKLMIYAVLFINLFFPWGISLELNFMSLLFSVFTLFIKLVVLCVILAIAETNLAKLRLFRAPYLLNIAFLFCLLGMLNHIILEIG